MAASSLAATTDVFMSWLPAHLAAACMFVRMYTRADHASLVCSRLPMVMTAVQKQLARPVRPTRQLGQPSQPKRKVGAATSADEEAVGLCRSFSGNRTSL